MEDAERILSNFLAYSVSKLIKNNDCRKVAAFQLHLDGPAKSWFDCPDNETKNTLENLRSAFKAKYFSENNKSVMLVEKEHFLSLCLLPHHQLEDYFTKIMDKGWKIGKKK